MFLSNSTRKIEIFKEAISIITLSVTIIYTFTINFTHPVDDRTYHFEAPSEMALSNWTTVIRNNIDQSIKAEVISISIVFLIVVSLNTFQTMNIF